LVALDFVAARYGQDPMRVWRAWTPRQLLLAHKFARRGKWYDDELVIRYGGGGHKREEPDFDAMTAEGVQRNRDEVELQRMLQAKNKARIAAIKRSAQEGRRVNRGEAMGTDRSAWKPTKILRTK
jgi:hypothetical protein